MMLRVICAAAAAFAISACENPEQAQAIRDVINAMDDNNNGGVSLPEWNEVPYEQGPCAMPGTPTFCDFETFDQGDGSNDDVITLPPQ